MRILEYIFNMGAFRERLAGIRDKNNASTPKTPSAPEFLLEGNFCLFPLQLPA